MLDYRSPWWLPGGNLQTIWPALFARRTAGDAPAYRRERWTTPDGDFLDLDWLVGDPAAGRPLLVLFHGGPPRPTPFACPPNGERRVPGKPVPRVRRYHTRRSPLCKI